MLRHIRVASIALTLAACGNQAAPAASTEQPQAAAAESPPANDTPPLDPENIVSIASNSQDHTTLVAALRAADYVTGVANPGPLTVFAPTNAAFAALPAGTVDNLLKPENVAQLRHVLQHHVAPAVYLADSFTDGQRLGMVDGTAVTMHIRDGQLMVEDAKVVASIRASNGIIHVIDKVLVPAAPAH